MRLRAPLLVLTIAAAVQASDADRPPEPLWLVGDLHVHVSPPDTPGHSTFTVATAIEAARKAGLDFVVLTPHERTIPPDPGDLVPKSGDAQALMQRLAAECIRPGKDAAPQRPFLAVAGWEFTRDDPGHLGLSFFRAADISGAEGDENARIVLAKGGLVVVNHPFFRPVESDLALMRQLTGDRGWRPFVTGQPGTCPWNAIEVWHERSVLVQRLHAKRAEKFPDTQMVTRALAAWDAATLATKRRIVAVGGSDCHGKMPYTMLPMAMVSVRVESFDEDALRRGLLAAHVTFGQDGGAAARDFAATSDVAGETAAIGDSLRAKSDVRLSWSGRAKLVENGEPVGDFDGGTTRHLDPPGSFRCWRIEKEGDAYSNMIYANLP